MIDQSPLISTPAGPLTLPVEKASLVKRFLAFIIDMIILSVVDGLVSRLFGNLQIIPTAMSAIYFIWFYSTSGRTLGKRILGIQVISIDGSALNWRQGVLRFIGYILSALTFGVGFLWAIRDADKQAGQDKIAGTYVVPTSATRNQLQGIIGQLEMRRRQRRWFLGLGIPALAIGVGLGYLVWRSVAEVREMGSWPGPEVSPSEVATADLSPLGFTTGKLQNARDTPNWAQGIYKDGVLVTYWSGAEEVAAIFALRYEGQEAAGDDFNVLRAWSLEPGNCGASASAYFFSYGMIRCQFSNEEDKIFWNDDWIVHIVTFEGSQFAPDVLVDRVRDAIAAHWKTLAEP